MGANIEFFKFGLIFGFIDKNLFSTVRKKFERNFFYDVRFLYYVTTVMTEWILIFHHKIGCMAKRRLFALGNDDKMD